MVGEVVDGARSGVDVHVRRRLRDAARTAAISGAAVLVAGLVLAVQPKRSPAVATGAAVGVAGSTATPSPAPAPTVAAVRLSPTGTATSPVTWRVRRTGDRRKDTALDAYQLYLGTAVRLNEEPDQSDPALPQVAIDPELARLRKGLSVSDDSQLSRRGRVLASARLQSLRGSEAVVVGCVDSTAQRLYGAGTPSPRWRAGVAVSLVRLRWDDGQWKVYRTAPLPLSRCRR